MLAIKTNKTLNLWNNRISLCLWLFTITTVGYQIEFSCDVRVRLVSHSFDVEEECLTTFCDRPTECDSVMLKWKLTFSRNSVFTKKTFPRVSQLPFGLGCWCNRALIGTLFVQVGGSKNLPLVGDHGWYFALTLHYWNCYSCSYFWHSYERKFAWLDEQEHFHLLIFVLASSLHWKGNKYGINEEMKGQMKVK